LIKTFETQRNRAKEKTRGSAAGKTIIETHQYVCRMFFSEVFDLSAALLHRDISSAF
jgi:hypothetical protein